MGRAPISSCSQTTCVPRCLELLCSLAISGLSPVSKLGARQGKKPAASLLSTLAAPEGMANAGAALGKPLMPALQHLASPSTGGRGLPGDAAVPHG